MSLLAVVLVVVIVFTDRYVTLHSTNSQLSRALRAIPRGEVGLKAPQVLTPFHGFPQVRY